MAKELSVPGGSIAYTDTGSGLPLVFVHGFLLSRSTWRKVIPSLAPAYRCIAVDLLGAGESRASDDADVSLDGQIAALVALLTALEIPAATWIAHDSGAVITRELAVRHPSRVSALVLSDTELPGPRNTSFAVADKLVRLPGMRGLATWLLGSRIVWTRQALGRGIHDLATFDRDEFLRTHREPLRTSVGRRQAALRFALQWDGDAVNRIQHDRLEMPKLVLWGEDDAFVTPARAKAFCDSLPNPRTFATIPNCGTLPHEERPNEWLQSVESFLASSIQSEA